MTNYNFLYVEDQEIDIKNLSEACSLYDEQNDFTIDLVSAHSYDEAEKILNENNDIDGVIADINLHNQSNPDSDDKSGNDVVNNIVRCFRLPVVMYTGTPADDGSIVPKFLQFTKDKPVNDVLNALVSVIKTGVFDIFGPNGILAKEIDELFWGKLYPNIDSWTKASDEVVTRKSLQRHVSMQIIEDLSSDGIWLENEVYILVSEDLIDNGVILFQDGSYFLVLSPSCDLVLHNDKSDPMKSFRNSEVVMVCEIAPYLQGVEKSVGKVKDGISNKKDFLHFLPSSKSFDGGFVNFRQIRTIPFNDTQTLTGYKSTGVKISQPFMSNILGRFSSYYGRQGQPDFDLRRIESDLKTVISEEISKSEAKVWTD